jgi:hypothetical protein
MPRKQLFYSFLTFVLLPVAGILGIGCVVAIPSAVSSPLSLLDLFILVSFVLYTFSSYSFFTRGVQNQKPFKASFKDFIKVNGYVAVISSTLTVLFAILFYTLPAFKIFVVNGLVKMQPTSAGMDKERLTAVIGKGLLGSAGYSALIIIHFIITIQLIKQYSNLFVKKAD